MKNKHKHLIISATFESPPFVSTKFTADWIRELVGKIDMQILYAPRAVMCDKEGNEGISAFCLITTSHICLHTWDKADPHLIQLDVYSCKEYDKNIVLKEIQKFNPLSLKHKFIDRSTFNEDI